MEEADDRSVSAVNAGVESSAPATESTALQAVPEVRLPFLPDTPPPPPPAVGSTSLRLGALVIGAAVGWALGQGALAYAAGIFGGGMFALLLAYGQWTMRRARRYDAETREVLGALGRGDHARARALLAPWLGGGPPVVRIFARHNLAWTELTDGQPAEAIALLAANEGERKHLRSIGMSATCALNLGLAHALLGELAAAQAWLEEADRRAAITKRGRATDPGMKTYVRAILDCRGGRPADAARDLAERWAELDAIMSGALLRPVRIVRAYAVAAADLRNAGNAERLLAPPTYPGEYDFLAVHWPEMAQFLAAHRFGGEPTDPIVSAGVRGAVP